MGKVSRAQFIYIHESHLDLFWLGSYQTCLERGNHILKQYIDRCRDFEDESFLIETVVFLQHFLKTHPEYEKTVQELWYGGQIDIGSVYVDIWNNSVLGESHIRNLVEGRKWLKEKLGLDVTLAVHPDLPGLAPQTPQIYAKSGLKYYSTSRKIFPYGGIWMFEAPDQSQLMIFNHPTHYLFNPLKGDEISKDQTDVYEVEKVLEKFPLNKVLLSGGAGDLADMNNFKRRMGHDLRDILDYYRETFPDIDFSFGTISSVLAEYEKIKEKLPHLQGEIPSIWGADESIDFFRSARILEGKLLTAELMESISKWLGFTSICSEREEWHGIYHDYAFFREKDTIKTGEELPTLWRMHLFTQDHNGGGHEGALSEFQKRTIQNRAIVYADQIIDHHLNQYAKKLPNQAQILLINPLNRSRYDPVELKIPSKWITSGFKLKDLDGNYVPWQLISNNKETDTNGKTKVVIACPIEGVGYTTLKVTYSHDIKQNTLRIEEDDHKIEINTDYLALVVNKQTGSLDKILDKKTSVDWGTVHVNRLYAMKELKNDTTIRIDETDIAASEEVKHVEIFEVGTLFIKIKIKKIILHAQVEQVVTVWLEDLNLFDIKTIIWWHGQHNIQLRQCLPTTESRDLIHYGTPFYGNQWTNVVDGSGPYMIDEITQEDYPFYREAQLWLNQAKGKSALAMSSIHPTFHWGNSGLEGVLIRTPQSCGDPRFYWENNGRQEFNFRFKFGRSKDSNTWAYNMGQEILQPPVVKVISGCGDNKLPSKRTFIKLSEDNIILSSVNADSKGTVIRFFETEGKETVANLYIQGLEQVDIMSLDEKVIQTIEVEGEVCQIPVKAYEIMNIRIKVKD